MKRTFLTLAMILSILSVATGASADNGGGWSPKEHYGTKKGNLKPQSPIIYTLDNGGGW